ncbi:Exopolyphosphatase [Arachnomyces sp. PD_36]|nr:Exopolyphosphatase [Arachnomyces sp. PD_36]
MSLPKRFGLLQFLKKAVQSHRTPPVETDPTYVVGNPSADLDSIISAIVYAYFSTREYPDTGNTHQYIPVINLPDVPPGKELRRLRPEFATALRLSTGPAAGIKPENLVESEGAMLENCAFTVADWRASWEANTRLNEGRRVPEDERPVMGPEINIVMVDWNVLPKIPPWGGLEGLTHPKTKNIRMTVVGCVDHHVDESYVPPPSHLSGFETRVIQTGVGSCASLVVRDLRSRGLWNDGPAPRADLDFFESGGSNASPEEEVAAIYESQVAKLALAAILIDTANMTAEDKVSEVDYAAVGFLEDKIQRGIKAERACGRSDGWDRDQFYEEILHAKRTSLENLTVQEALGRDFKEWTETTVSGTSTEDVKLGICSVVSPLSWLISKSKDSNNENIEKNDGISGKEVFFNELKQFASTKDLHVVAVMTAFQSSNPDKSFQRELLVWALNEKPIESLRRFESDATTKLGLGPWETDGDGNASDDGQEVNLSNSSQWRRIWNQAVVSQSRKQVAPLLRNAIARKDPVKDKL